MYPWCSQRCSTVYKLKYSKLNINNNLKKQLFTSEVLIVHSRCRCFPRSVEVRANDQLVWALVTYCRRQSHLHRFVPASPPHRWSTVVTSRLYIVAVTVGGDCEPVGVTRTTSSVESMFGVKQETAHALSELRMLQN